MDWALQLTIFAPAFVAGILVLLTHVPLGREVLRRGIIFIDLAIAQIAGLGVIAAHALQWHTDAWTTQLVALSAAMGGALLLGIAEKHLENRQEALIGIVFVLAATASLLLLAGNPQGGEHLRDLLTGQILWVNWSDLMPLALLATVYWVLRWLKPTALTYLFGRHRFYLTFAVVITFSVQIVGVYLVFASLVIPAFAVLNRARPLVTALLLGLIGYVLGIVASSLIDLPTGATIVWLLAVVAVVYRSFSNHHSLV